VIRARKSCVAKQENLSYINLFEVLPEILWAFITDIAAIDQLLQLESDGGPRG